MALDKVPAVNRRRQKGVCVWEEKWGGGGACEVVEEEQERVTEGDSDETPTRAAN